MGSTEMEVVLLLLCLAGATTLVNSESSSLPGCPSKCGDVEVPYPFGIRDECARETFLLKCNETDYNPPKLFRGNIEITSISLSDGYTGVMLPIARDCYNSTGAPLNTGIMSANLSKSPFTISALRNRFTAIGCDTLAYILDPINSLWTGCASLCNYLSLVEDGNCFGIGCCQTYIPKGLKYYPAQFQTFYNHKRVRSFNPCSYAFVVDQEAFSFTTSFLIANYTNKSINLPVVFDWSIEGTDGGDCQTAQKNKTSYACVSTNSTCSPSRNGLGYLCNCSQGYEGNPYLDGGCKDIDECLDKTKYPCNGVCSNTPGYYNCTCPPGSHADDPKKDKCVLDPLQQKFPTSLKLVIGVGPSMLFLIILSYWTHWIYKKRKFIQLKQKFFEQNGGRFLQQQISSQQTTSFKIFTMAEIKKATNNLDKNKILGKGGHGIVYKGSLDDGRIVAVKISMMIDDNKSKEFAKELFILSQINHKHVVKILGCCLEVEVPILVYEYIPKGTLFHYLHKSDLHISFIDRLRIAAESADALSYLHSAADPPILHGDVKSSNILLDENYTAKVSDFGTSTLAPNDKTQFTTMVQGTCGYLDPEYLQTCQLTEKSDVYSFGVVLVELFTRKMALYFEVGEKEKSTALNFIRCMNDNRLAEVLDPRIVEEPLSETLQDIAELTLRCLSVKGEERPTMREVFMALETLRSSASKHPWVGQNPEEVECLLGGTSGVMNSYDASSFFSLEIQAVKDMDDGR